MPADWGGFIVMTRHELSGAADEVRTSTTCTAAPLLAAPRTCPPHVAAAHGGAPAAALHLSRLGPAASQPASQPASRPVRRRTARPTGSSQRACCLPSPMQRPVPDSSILPLHQQNAPGDRPLRHCRLHTPRCASPRTTGAAGPLCRWRWPCWWTTSALSQMGSGPRWAAAAAGVWSALGGLRGGGAWLWYPTRYDV
jgi:hypothetical protein